ncbi:adenylate/guanylate cyclase domain-containing protein [Candidatus Woesearchaeota archaeon]|nr:adenylate/guanylate cyclase domain-containing protein [Candidatus Woesearchaeota archaeon]
MFKNKFFNHILIAIGIAVLLSLLFNLGVFYSWEIKLDDALYGDKTAIKDISIIAIDDKSIQEIGRWPWDRTVFIDILEKLNNTAVTGIDVAFFEPFDEEIDKKLAEQIKKNNNVVLPVEYMFDNNKITTELLAPIPELKEAAARLAFINFYTDTDGIVRSVPLNVDNNYNSFSSEIYSLYLNKEFVFDEDRLLVNFVGKPYSFRTVSFVDVIEDKIDTSEFNNKIVLIGATSPDLHDDYIVPTSEGKAMPGVELHANALQTMITKNFLACLNKIYVFLIIFLLTLITSILLSKLRMRYGTPALAAIAAIYLIIVFKYFDKGLILPIIYPILAIGFTYVAIVLFSYFYEERTKRWVINIFGKYTSKAVVDDILQKAEKDNIDLQGEERNVTILFADIRGFTAMSEKMTPHEVVSMLNKYLGEMTESVFNFEGTLDKYIGDCIMAIFNAPLEQPDHAMQAIKASMDMQERIKQVQSKEKDVPRVDVGIGLNTGPAVIGNIGSQKRVDYTAIGDTVNTASRMCSLAGKGELIITENTYKLVKDKIKVKKLDPVKVKGKEKPLQVYLVEKIL